MSELTTKFQITFLRRIQDFSYEGRPGPSYGRLFAKGPKIRLLRAPAVMSWNRQRICAMKHYIFKVFFPSIKMRYFCLVLYPYYSNANSGYNTVADWQDIVSKDKWIKENEQSIM